MNFSIQPWRVTRTFKETYQVTSQYIKIYLLFIYYNSSVSSPHSINWTQLYLTQDITGLRLKPCKISRLIKPNRIHTFLNKKVMRPALRTQTTLTLPKVKFYAITLWWLQVTIPQSNHWAGNNAKFRFFFSSSHSSKVDFTLVSIERYIWRITDSLIFLSNLFYIDAHYWMLGNELFLEEILIFNWESRLATFRIFKSLNTSVYFKDLPHGAATRNALRLLSKIHLDFTIITDIKTHYRMQKYLHNLNVFTIGLIPTNYSPWSVSYPIPTYSHSPKSQFLFIHLIFHLRNRIVN